MTDTKVKLNVPFLDCGTELYLMFKNQNKNQFKIHYSRYVECNNSLADIIFTSLCRFHLLKSLYIFHSGKTNATHLFSRNKNMLCYDHANPGQDLQISSSIVIDWHDNRSKTRLDGRKSYVNSCNSAIF